jgi:DMSO/TMAO reductase YedYZ molybdopterin-dependent catalytic subunit
MADANEKPKQISKFSNTTKIIALAVVAILLVAIPLGYLYLQGQNKEEPTSETIVSVVKGLDERNLTLDNMKDMTSVQGTSSYQNRFGNWRGLGEYKGVTLQRMADLVGGMQSGDVMTISASDGYEQNLSYYQVYADASYQAVQGWIILAYQFNTTEVPDWADGPMIAVLAPDGAFSNVDFNATAAKDQEYLSSTSAGSIWVKNVERIEIQTVFTEWTVQLKNLEGTMSNLTRTKYVALDYQSDSYVVDSKSRNWTGAPVPVILGLVDDSNPNTFNQSLADTGYRVRVSASDGYNKTLVAKDLVEVGAIFAYKMNGSLLGSNNAPLKLVGSGMTGSDMVSKIVSVEFLEPEVQVLTVQSGETILNFTLPQVMAMDTVTSSGGLMKSTGTILGPNEFTGVPVRDLVGLVFSGSNFSLEVVATDGYSMTYSSSQAINGTFAYYDANGSLIGPGDFTMLLAYEQDGAPIPDMTFRIVIVGDGSPITDGHFWAKYVRTLTVKPFIQDWTVNLTGLTLMEMDRQTFESIASCPWHTLEYTFQNAIGNHTYEGVALWVLVAAVDGADAPDGHYMFNDALALAGYNVTVIAGDGYSKTFTSAQVARNDSMIVAHRLDGEPLPADEFPLHLVGEGLTSGQKVKMIASIELTDMPTLPTWNLTLVGTSTLVLDAAEYTSLFFCGVHAAYYNYSDGVANHSYAGVPLWVLVGAVDGTDVGHYEFNTSLAALGYSVKIIASDGYNATIPIADIAMNNSLILAFMWDGVPLTGSDAPLKLVGENLPGSMRVKGVVQIELVDLPT